MELSPSRAAARSVPMQRVVQRVQGVPSRLQPWQRTSHSVALWWICKGGREAGEGGDEPVLSAVCEWVLPRPCWLPAVLYPKAANIHSVGQRTSMLPVPLRSMYLMVFTLPPW